MAFKELDKRNVNEVVNDTITVQETVEENIVAEPAN